MTKKEFYTAIKNGEMDEELQEYATEKLAAIERAAAKDAEKRTEARTEALKVIAERIAAMPQQFFSDEYAAEYGLTVPAAVGELSRADYAGGILAEKTYERREGKSNQTRVYTKLAADDENDESVMMWIPPSSSTAIIAPNK